MPGPLLFFNAARMSSTSVDYTPGAVQNPESVVEQALMEQEEGERPEAVRVTREYVEWTEGVTGRTNMFGHSESKAGVQRLYWRTAVDERLYTKRGHWVAQFRNAQGTTLLNVSTDSRDTGQRLLDAVRTLRERE
ncbi:hypothetical protein P0D72_26070 [Paraburkholderia sediminicola]|uniref:hypothetical protein n=1 Tax=Paraburkholderia sediminicola TaxID=458836 RepID=UPI0038BCDD44